MFLRTGAFFSSILSEFLKNLVALHLARKLNVSVFAIRSWEQEKSAPSHEMLVRVCRLYQVSSDYLLGLSNIDPVYEQRRRLEQFSPEELTDLKKYESYLLWKKRSEKNKT